MTRWTGFALGFVAVWLSGCRRGESPILNSTEETAGVVVDAGCPQMVDGQCVHEPAPPVKPGVGTKLYGEALGPSPVTALSAILEQPDKYHQKKVTVSGHVRRACSKKGCWMELAETANENSERCRVTFKDYGFLVPTNSAGSQAKLEGTVQVTQVKKKAVEHYEAEGATFKTKGDDGSAQEVRLVATGVELTRT